MVLAYSAEGSSLSRTIGPAARFPEVLGEIRKLEEARRSAALNLSHSPFAPAESFVIFVPELINTKKL